MARQITFTAHYVEGDNGWILGFVAEFPAVITQGRTIEQVRHRLREAVELLIEANEETLREKLAQRRVVLVEEQTIQLPT